MTSLLILLITYQTTAQEITLKPQSIKLVEGKPAPFTGFLLPRERLDTCVTCLKNQPMIEENLLKLHENELKKQEMDDFHKTFFNILGGFALGFTLSVVLYH